MSLKPPTYANQPQFTEVFDSTSPILRSWTAVFATADIGEVLQIPAQGPNFYVTKVVSPGSIEISFDSPGPNWAPVKPGMGFQGQNFRRIFLRRTGSAYFYDSVEMFAGGAFLTNFEATYREAGRRNITTVGHFQFSEGLILPGNPKRKSALLQAIFPSLDSNDVAVVGFGNSITNAQINAVDIFNTISNNPAEITIGYDYTNGPISQGKNLKSQGFYAASDFSIALLQPMRLECVIEDTQDIYMSCFNTGSNDFTAQTFFFTPSFLKITEIIYD